MNQSNNNELIYFVANRIRKIRKERKISQESLSIAAGLDSKYINKLENFHFSCTIETLEKILHVLDISYSEFFQFDIHTNNTKIQELLVSINELPKDEQSSKIDSIIKLLE